MCAVKLDVLMCFDRSFIFGAGAFISSLIKNNEDIDFIFHICQPVSDRQIIAQRLISRINSIFHSTYTFNQYNFEDFAQYKFICQKLNSRMAAQCVRLFAGEIFSYSGNLVLYADADIICLQSIKELIKSHLNHGVAVKAMAGSRALPSVCGTPIKNYFWSGLMLINVNEWRTLNIGERASSLVCKYKPKFADQDTLNALLQDRWEAFPEHVQSLWEYHQDIIFLHYVTGKPWMPWMFKYNREAVSLFRQYAKLFEPDVTKWISFKESRDVLVNFSQVSARKASKWIAMLLLKRHSYKGFIYFYFKHIVLKFKQKGLIGVILMRSNTRS